MTDARDVLQMNKRKYSQADELALQRERATQGFHLCESRMIDAHFSKLRDLLVSGCGAGREALAFAARGFTVHAIDLNEDLLRVARELSDAITGFSVQNVMHLGFRDAAFDGVTLLAQILTMVPGRANRLLALREAYRVLRPGGLIMVTTHNRRFSIKQKAYFAVMNPLRAAGRALGLKVLEPGDFIGANVSEEKRSREPSFRHLYLMEEMIDDLNSAGFEMVDCRSRDELNRDVNEPAVREKDYYLYYVARKPR